MTTRAELRATRAMLRALLVQGRHGLSLGRVKEAVALVKAQPRLAAHLVNLMFDEDAGVSQRAADVLERVTAHGTAREMTKASDNAAATIDRVLARNKDTILGTADGGSPGDPPHKVALECGAHGGAPAALGRRLAPRVARALFVARRHLFHRQNRVAAGPGGYDSIRPCLAACHRRPAAHPVTQRNGGDAGAKPHSAYAA